MLFKKIFVLVLLLFYPLLSFAQESFKVSENSLKHLRIDIPSEVVDKEKTKKDAFDGKEKFTEFYGIKFGIGFALTFKHGEDRIYSAIVDGNGIVRVDKEANREPKVMLETHYFRKWEKASKFLGRPCGIGPFFGIQPDNSNGGLIGAYALGVMLGLKHNNDPEEKDSRSWNIGVAYVVNTGVRTLGDGLEQGKPLPEGETQIRYKEINQPGWLVMISFAF